VAVSEVAEIFKEIQKQPEQLFSDASNGILEGINNKVQLAKRRARGFRNLGNFINMIYFLCGKLKFDYPLYFTWNLFFVPALPGYV
jgi:hypothetical protein